MINYDELSDYLENSTASHMDVLVLENEVLIAGEDAGAKPPAGMKLIDCLPSNLMIKVVESVDYGKATVHYL